MSGRDKAPPPKLAQGTKPDGPGLDGRGPSEDARAAAEARAAEVVERYRAARGPRRGRLRDSEVNRLPRRDLERLVHNLQRVHGLQVSASFDGIADEQLRAMAHDLRARPR